MTQSCCINGSHQDEDCKWKQKMRGQSVAFAGHKNSPLRTTIRSGQPKGWAKLHWVWKEWQGFKQAEGDICMLLIPLIRLHPNEGNGHFWSPELHSSSTSQATAFLRYFKDIYFHFCNFVFPKLSQNGIKYSKQGLSNQNKEMGTEPLFGLDLVI